MDNPFRTPEDYELFLYTITERFPAVWRSTITFVRIGATLANKHIPPDIKHNRIPAPEMSFNRPNLPALIQEVEKLINSNA